MIFNKEQLDKVKTVIGLIDNGAPRVADLQKLVRVLISGVQSVITQAVADLNKRIDDRLAQIRQPKDGAKGDKGDKGDTVVGPRGAQGERGEKGDAATPADEDAIVQRIELDLPKLGTVMRDALELLQDGERLKASAIDGLEEFFPKPQEGPTVLAPSRGMFLFLDGVKKGLVSNLNLKPGPGVSLAYSKVNGQDTITINASGGGAGGVTVETPPEAPDASATIFSVSAQPQWVVADGITYYEGKGYSYAALHITMDVAPSQFIRAII